MISMAEITDACELFTDDTSLDAQLASLLPSDATGAASLLSEAMLDADAAISLAADAESLNFEECARACGAGAFFNALRESGLLRELPALCADPPPNATFLTVFAPPAEALAAAYAAGDVRELLAAHVVAGELPPADIARSLGGTAHRLRFTPSGELAGVGNADVAPPAARWRHGVLHCIDRALLCNLFRHLDLVLLAVAADGRSLADAPAHLHFLVDRRDEHHRRPVELSLAIALSHVIV